MLREEGWPKAKVRDNGQTAGKAETRQRIGVREKTPAVASTRGIYLGSRLLGDNYWPYGMKANHKELELVMRYTHEQGLAKRRLKVDEVFHPSTLNLIER